MVVQKTINNLKERPHDERKAVAGGIAIFVVIVLMIAWGFVFLKRIQSGSQQVSLDSGAQSEFNPSNVTAAQQQIEAQGSGSSNVQELYQIRNQSASNQMQIEQQSVAQQSGQTPDPFSNPSSY